MCRQIRTHKIKRWKFVNFGAGNSCYWVRSMKKQYGNFPFSHRIILKQNYVVIFILLSSVNIGLGCIELLLDSQCIEARRTSNIKSWTGQPSSPSCAYIQVGQGEGVGTLSIVYKFRYSHLEGLHKKYLFWKLWKSWPMVGSCSNNIARPVTLLK